MKFGLVVLISVYLFVLPLLNATYASLLTITKNSDIVVKVLSEQDSFVLEVPVDENLKVESVNNEMASRDDKISLSKDDRGVSVTVTDKNKVRIFDVTKYKDDIIEIEKSTKPERVVIGYEDGKYSIKQNRLIAKTDFDVEIDPRKPGLMLSTPDGSRYLSIFPIQATQAFLRTNLVDRIMQENNIQIVENDGELVYEVEGEKVFNILNLTEFTIPIRVFVSAQTAELKGIIKPDWLSVLSFLFTT